MSDRDDSVPVRIEPGPRRLLDGSDLRALAVFVVALLLFTAAVLWLAGLGLIVKWLWGL